MTRHYAAYSDAAYLPRLKALYASMVRHCGDFMLHVLAWDDGVYYWAMDSNISVVHIRDFVSVHSELSTESLPGPPRSRVEHMWTVGPTHLASVMEQTGEPVTYVDADVMFHSSPDPVFDEIGGAPAAVVPHGFCDEARWPIPTHRTHDVFGLYNVGIVHIRDPKVVADWAERCREHCYAKLTDHYHELFGPILKFGDQRYLNAWPSSFGAHVIRHPGACAGPWAVHAQTLRRTHDGQIFFGGRPLVSWHYSGYRELPDGHTVLTRPEYMLTDEQAEILYRPYFRALDEAKR